MYNEIKSLLLSNAIPITKNMTISNANIVTCPYCGAKKELMSLNSSNNIGAQYWSDLKTIAPMDPKISPVPSGHTGYPWK